MRERDLDMSDVLADAQRMRDAQEEARDAEMVAAGRDRIEAEISEEDKQEAAYNEIVTALQGAGYTVEHLSMGIINLATNGNPYVATLTISRTPGY